MKDQFPKSIAIAIPAYKAEKELSQFLPHLITFVPAEQITVLLDGVYDNSEEVCKQFNVNCSVQKENRGKGAALFSLFDILKPRYEWIITMDADGQHAPEDLVQFVKSIEQINDQHGLILGSRPRSKSTMPLLRRFSNGTTSGFISLVTGQKIEDSQCGYRAYRSEPIDALRCKSTRFEMESEFIIRASAKGFLVTNVPITTNYNGETSHISHVKDTLRWISTVFKTIFAVKQENK